MEINKRELLLATGASLFAVPAALFASADRTNQRLEVMDSYLEDCSKTKRKARPEDLRAISDADYSKFAIAAPDILEFGALSLNELNLTAHEIAHLGDLSLMQKEIEKLGGKKETIASFKKIYNKADSSTRGLRRAARSLITIATGLGAGYLSYFSLGPSDKVKRLIEIINSSANDTKTKKLLSKVVRSAGSGDQAKTHAHWAFLLTLVLTWVQRDQEVAKINSRTVKAFAEVAKNYFDKNNELTLKFPEHVRVKFNDLVPERMKNLQQFNKKIIATFQVRDGIKRNDFSKQLEQGCELRYISPEEARREIKNPEKQKLVPPEGCFAALINKKAHILGDSFPSEKFTSVKLHLEDDINDDDNNDEPTTHTPSDDWGKLWSELENFTLGPATPTRGRLSKVFQEPALN